jgi:hypothetical protein
MLKKLRLKISQNKFQSRNLNKIKQANHMMIIYSGNHF